MPLTIAQASQRSGCSAPTIRYYESIGLIGRADRGSNGRRSFGQVDVHRLSFIRRCRDFGLSIEQTRGLIAASTQGLEACVPAQAIVTEQLKTIRARRIELRLLESNLQQILDRCCTVCATGEAVACSIFEDIGATP
jgi:MerR family transcriptional regulator, copper efflux regulator